MPLHLSRVSDIMTSEPAVLTAWVNGCKCSAGVLKRMDQNTQNYLAAAIPHSARSISGERQSSKKYQTIVVLMRSDTSPLW